MKLNIPDEVKSLISKFNEANQQIFIVGGAVRDLLLNREVKDWDFATNATPTEILKIIPEGFYNNQFGTVGLTTKIGTFEITTFRKESDYADFRHPSKIEWGKTIEEDLARRDFTINAMALIINSKTEPKIIDLYNGKADLEKMIIRAVGNPYQRFKEDALRMLRAIRIAAELKFTIDEQTLNAITTHAELINYISKERVRDELLKILSTDKPADAFWLMRNVGLLKEIIPELEKCFEVEQKSPGRHHIYNVGTHCLKSLEFCPSKDPVVRLATLLHDIGKPEVVGKGPKNEITFYNHEVVGAHIAANIATRLKFSKKDKEKIVTLVRWHQFSVDEATTPTAVRRFIERVGPDNIKNMIDLRIGDRLGSGLKRAMSWRLKRFIKMVDYELHPPFKVTDLAVNGHDVMKIMNIPPGPQVGKILNQLFEEVLENKQKNTREYLIKRLKQLSQLSKNSHL